MDSLTQLTHSQAADLKFLDYIARLESLEDIILERFHAFESDRAMSVANKASEFVDVQEKIQQIQYSRKRTPYWFVTINPKPEVTYEEFHSRINDLLSNDSIEEFLYSFEVRNSDYTGLHAHVLFVSHTRDPNFASRKVRALFVPELCANTKHVDIKWVHEHDLPDVISYIKKDKVSKSKKASNNFTLQWREQESIPSHFVQGEHLTCLCSPPSNLISLN